jgi:hypothetical protein
MQQIYKIQIVYIPSFYHTNCANFRIRKTVYILFEYVYSLHFMSAGRPGNPYRIFRTLIRIATKIHRTNQGIVQAIHEWLNVKVACIIYESAYPWILRINAPEHFMDQRTRAFYGSAYPWVLWISVPVYFTNRRNRAGT